MTTSNVVSIVNGPAISHLCHALEHRTKVMFALKFGTSVISVVTFVNGIEVHKDDDDAESVGSVWILKLYDPHTTMDSHELFAYFNTKTRKGHVGAAPDSLAA